MHVVKKKIESILKSVKTKKCHETACRPQAKCMAGRNTKSPIRQLADTKTVFKNNNFGVFLCFSALVAGKD